jgi:hypothetical protein
MSRSKLVLRRETLRVLAGMEFVLVAGGGNPDPRLFDTRNPATGYPGALLDTGGGPATGYPNVSAALPVKP